jgi:hypothetical protein
VLGAFASAAITRIRSRRRAAANSFARAALVFGLV